MFDEIAFGFTTTMLILAMKIANAEENPKISGYELILSKVDSRLNIASQIIETARQQYEKDLKQLCRNGSCPQKFINFSKWGKRHPDEKPVDCSDIYNDGYHKDGIYTIWPKSKVGIGPLHVYCDMKDGGGWTVIQRRGDYANAKDYFYQDWNAYKVGFGHILREFWIGNDNLFALTGQRSYQLRVDLRDFEENFRYATYNKFWIDDELHDYTLHVDGYTGTAGDSLMRHNGAKFSTKDQDNDQKDSAECAVVFEGAWWFESCMDSNLNSVYSKNGNISYGTGVIWSTFKGFTNPLKDSIMKIRPVDFERYNSAK